MERIMLFQTAIDSYRERFFSELQNRNLNLSISCGDTYFTGSVRTRITHPHNNLRNKYIFNRRLLFQLGAISIARGKTKIVIEMNPRIISNWILILLSIFKRQEVFVWGHFYGRNNDATQISIWRRLMCILATGGILAYTKVEQQLFLGEFPKKRVYSVTNSLYFKKDMIPIQFGEDARDFAYCGRLDEDKQVEDLVWAFENVLESGEIDSRLHIIGDGPLLSKLKQIVEKNKMEKSIIFHGYITDVAGLRAIFRQCCAQVTNGFVGLNVVQCLGFQLPLIYPKTAKLRHAPESYLLNAGNSIATEGTVESFAMTISHVYLNRKYWHGLRGNISSAVLENHTIECMADGFMGVLSETR
jgi:glycosyltransferase involved in cell wall biosynthesis